MRKNASDNHRKRLLLIEDDELFSQALVDYLSPRYAVRSAEDARQAWDLIAQEIPELILLDFTLPGQDGLGLLKSLKEKLKGIPVIMLTAMDRIQTVVECMKSGAADYLTKPIISEELLASVERALESVEMKRELDQRRELQLVTNREYRLVGDSAELQKVRHEIQVVSRSDSPVLVVGETGTGKELAAREIHAYSARASGPFVALNCGAIPKDLFETEFFGYKKGAFTGAQSGEIGKFLLANNGTLLLDEVGELPLDAQTKLLRALDEQEFYPVGSTELVCVNVRVIASTNRSLEQLVRDRLFREDLFFRLNVYTINMPPLRQRQSDILVLAAYFMNYFNTKFGKDFKKLSPQARDVLLSHPWKGNVRELRNLIERVVLAEDGSVIEKKHLVGMTSFALQETSSSHIQLSEHGMDLEALEKNLIRQALEIAHGNKTRAAKLLNMSPPTFYYRLEKYGL